LDNLVELRGTQSWAEDLWSVYLEVSDGDLALPRLSQVRRARVVLGNDVELQLGRPMVRFDQSKLSLGEAAILAGRHLVLSGGEVFGRGTLRGLVQNGGLIDPGTRDGQPFGRLTIDGALVGGLPGRVHLDLGGRTPDSRDLLVVNGDSELPMHVELAVKGGYLPLAGHGFPVIMWTGVGRGAPLGYSGLKIQADLEWEPVVNPKDQTVSAVSAAGPRVVSTAPNGVQAPQLTVPFGFWDVAFSELVDAATLPTNAPAVTGPFGAIPVTGVEALGRIA